MAVTFKRERALQVVLVLWGVLSVVANLSAGDLFPRRAATD